MEAKRLLSIAEMAEILSIKERTIRDWVYKGLINGLIVRAGSKIRINNEELNRRIDDGKVLD